MNPLIVAGKAVGTWIGNKALNTIAKPIDQMVDQNIADVTTSIGSFIIRKVRGRLQRTITFETGVSYNDSWMEEALYGILYEYNNIRDADQIELSSTRKPGKNTDLYSILGDGTHALKYRKWTILLNISSKMVPITNGRSKPVKLYTVITYDMDPNFVKQFEKDMRKHRDCLLKINADSPNLNVYTDAHENDGYTYWEMRAPIPKRRLNTIYLPKEQMKRIINTINEFFAKKEFYQEHGIPWNLKILFYGGPGTGKAQPLSTKIPTPNGWKTMGDLKVGDEVFTDDGSITTIDGVFPQGVKDVYRITFSDGRTAECTEDHLWCIAFRSHNETVYKVMSLKDIMNDDYARSVTKTNGQNTRRCKYAVPGLLTPVQYPHKEVPMDPYVVGAMIGNGCCREPALSISSGNDWVPTKIAHRCGFIARRESEYNYTYNFFDKNTGNKIRTKDFFSVLPEMIDKFSHEKAIPDIYMYNDAQTRLELLRGLMDTDGCITFDEGRYGVTYSSCSRKLLEQIRELVQSLGYNANIGTPDKRFDKYKTGYHAIIYFGVPNSVKPLLFSLPFKYEKAYTASMVRNSRRYDLILIENIELVRQEECQCIKVHSPSGLYLTDQYIITHNTSLVKMISSEFNRNLFECTGGKNGKFIPECLTGYAEDIIDPVFSISDIDKYPVLINEADTDITNKDDKQNDEQLQYKQLFNKMINALDGTSSGENRIIIMTTNHIEKFSQTFLRPGRIDLIEEIGYVVPETFRRFVLDFYNVVLPEDTELSRDNITIAEMQSDVLHRKMTIDEFTAKYVKAKK